MTKRISNIEIVREVETAVPTPNGVNRFVTIVGWIPDLPIAAGRRHVETYTCLVGPALREYEFLGASHLPSIVGLDVSTLELTQCSIDSSETMWDEDSGRTEFRVHVSAEGAAAKMNLLFSVTILAAR